MRCTTICQIALFTFLAAATGRADSPATQPAARVLPLYRSIYVSPGEVRWVYPSNWEQNGKWQGGFKGVDREWVLQPRWDYVEQFWEGLAAVRVGEKWGFVNLEGKMVIHLQFVNVGSHLGGFHEGLAVVSFLVDWRDESGKVSQRPCQGVIDNTGRMVARLGSEKIPGYPRASGRWQRFQDGLLPVVDYIQKEWRMGYVDGGGKYAIAPELAAAETFSEGLAAVVKEKGGKYGYIDRSGRAVIEPRFDATQPFHRGRALVSLGNKTPSNVQTWGGAAVLPTWDDMTSDTLYPVYNGWRYVDRLGNELAGDYYVLADGLEFREGLAPCCPEDKWGYIDEWGKVVIQPAFDKAMHFREGLARVKVGKLWGFIDKGGKMAVEPQYSSALDFSEGLAAVWLPGAGFKCTGYIDRSGTMVIRADFCGGRSFCEGLAKTNLWRVPQPDGSVRDDWHVFIDRTGKVVIDLAKIEGYVETRDFHEGLAAVCVRSRQPIDLSEPNRPRQFGMVQERWGFIDRTGRIVIEPQYTGAGDFHAGLAPIGGVFDTRQNRRMWGLIDKAGRVVIEPRFDEVGRFSEGLAPVRVGNRAWGFVDRDGRLVVPPRYGAATEFHGGLAVVRGFGPLSGLFKWGCIDRNGAWVAETFWRAPTPPVPPDPS